MKSPTMLYRCPGPEKFEGVDCETTVVDEHEVKAAKGDGWHSNWIEAGEAHAEAQAKVKAAEAKAAKK